MLPRRRTPSCHLHVPAPSALARSRPASLYACFPTSLPVEAQTAWQGTAEALSEPHVSHGCLSTAKLGIFMVRPDSMPLGLMPMPMWGFFFFFWVFFFFFFFFYISPASRQGWSWRLHGEAGRHAAGAHAHAPPATAASASRSCPCHPLLRLLYHHRLHMCAQCSVAQLRQTQSDSWVSSTITARSGFRALVQNSSHIWQSVVGISCAGRAQARQLLGYPGLDLWACHASQQLSRSDWFDISALQHAAGRQAIPA